VSPWYGEGPAFNSRSGLCSLGNARCRPRTRIHTW